MNNFGRNKWKSGCTSILSNKNKSFPLANDLFPSSSAARPASIVSNGPRICSKEGKLGKSGVLKSENDRCNE